MHGPRRLFAIALCLTLGACAQEARSDAPQRQHGNNPASMGFIDIPAANATVDTPVRVSGWALDESGVQSVRIFFDDELMATAPLVTKRPDVLSQFKRFTENNPLPGFEAIIDAGAHSGYVNIRAVAIDGKGAQTQIYSVSVRIRE